MIFLPVNNMIKRNSQSIAANLHLVLVIFAVAIMVIMAVMIIMIVMAILAVKAATAIILSNLP